MDILVQKGRPQKLVQLGDDSSFARRRLRPPLQGAHECRDFHGTSNQTPNANPCIVVTHKSLTRTAFLLAFQIDRDCLWEVVAEICVVLLGEGLSSNYCGILASGLLNVSQISIVRSMNGDLRATGVLGLAYLRMPARHSVPLWHSSQSMAFAPCYYTMFELASS